MHGIASLLDNLHTRKVMDIWHELSDKCNLLKPHEKQIPHFSWHFAEGYQWDIITVELGNYVKEINAFHVKTSGIGLFTGDHPVIYMPIVRSKKLNQIHQKIWQLVESKHKSGNIFYSQDNWMPHITLTYPEINPGKVNCALDILREHDLNWKIEIDNLSLISDPYEHKEGFKQRYNF